MGARKRPNVKSLDQDTNIVEIGDFREDRHDGGGARKRQDKQAQRFVKNVKPRTDGQAAYIEALRSHDITFGLGPAGTGKTYLAVCEAAERLKAGRIDRIIISRPVVEAGESLGFLPGGLSEKMDPWMRPIYDALSERMGAPELRHRLADGTIEIAPIAYLRGRTLGSLSAPCYTIVDEAQNLSLMQLKMVLTRLGEGGTMVLTGDPGQSDLPAGMSGLLPILNRLRHLPRIGIAELTSRDIVRHPLIAEMMPYLEPAALAAE
jgi:phosphate starvation-inducible PhoH-like protein